MDQGHPLPQGRQRLRIDLCHPVDRRLALARRDRGQTRFSTTFLMSVQSLAHRRELDRDKVFKFGDVGALNRIVSIGGPQPRALYPTVTVRRDTLRRKTIVAGGPLAPTRTPFVAELSQDR